MAVALSILVISTIVQTALSASCGTSGIPFRFEVLPSGKPVLGCAAPTCFGAENGGRDLQHDSSFIASSEGDDGFFRDGDLSRPRVRHPDAPAQQASCPGEFDATSCQNPMTWVGGFMADDNGDLTLQCCRYEGLKFSQEVGRPVVHPGEVYSGGEVLRDGRQTGFDMITNVRKIQDGNGAAYELTVTRMNCLPNPNEPTNQVSFDIQRDISRILDKVSDTAAHGVQTNEIEADQRLSPGDNYQPQLSSDQYAQPQQSDPAAQPPQQETVDQFVQVGEQVVPVTSAGYYYPVASGVPACFTANSTVVTPAGVKTMSQLKVGDSVLTSENGKMVYTRVSSWMHRLPTTKAAFIKLETEAGVSIQLTPQHFIYKTNCMSAEMSMVYAEDVHVGDCLLLKPDNHNVLKASKVSQRTADYSVGVYAPMTDAGDLIVDGVYASCHNVIKTSTLTHTFLSTVTKMQSFVREWFGSSSYDSGHLPATAEFFLSVVDVLLPHKY